MGALEEGGKAIGGVVEAMKSAPLALALLVVNCVFIAFTGYILHEMAAISRERNQSTSELIDTLVKECASGKPKASIFFRVPKNRTDTTDTKD